MFEIKPKTRKEIYMAYLAGDMSLELPEPMTRDDVTLYNLCQSHAYGSTTTVKEVLAECQPELVADMGMFMLSPVPEIEAGAAYIVNWNGVEHKCTAILASEDVASRNIVLGNMSADGGEDTGEPFLLVAQYGEQQACFVAPLDGSTTLTISIRQETETIHPIDQKFLPSNIGGGTVIKLKQTEDGYGCDEYTPKEILDILSADITTRVVLWGKNDGATLSIPAFLVMAQDSGATVWFLSGDSAENLGMLTIHITESEIFG